MLYPKINYKALKEIIIQPGNTIEYLANLFEDSELIASAKEDTTSGWIAVIVRFSDSTFALYEDTFFGDNPYDLTVDGAIAKCETLAENLVAICDTKEDMLRELRWDISSYYGGKDCGWAIELFEKFETWSNKQ